MLQGIIEVVGIMALILGFFLLYPPLAFIVGGAAVILLAQGVNR